jgi:hypothetical protein
VHPYLYKEAIFFHDCDFIFTKKMDFHNFLNDDKWYFSDCTSYIGYEYIANKSEALLELMCNTVDICSCKVKSNKDKGGGAQKLMKHVTQDYWENVERDSVNLYNLLSSDKVKSMRGKSDPNPIQAWTASMWAELWNAWKRGYTVEVPKEFDFAWATCIIDKWDQVNFYHNAGVQSSDKDMFYKGKYVDSLPYNENIEVNKGKCSSMYLKRVINTGKNSCLT